MSPGRSAIEEVSSPDIEDPACVTLVDQKSSSDEFLIKERGRRATWAMIPVLLWYVIYLVWALVTNNFMPTVIGAGGESRAPCTADHVTYAICVIGFSVLFLLGAELLYRGILLVEEIFHLRSRYHNSLREVIMETYSMKMGLLPYLLGIGWFVSLLLTSLVVPNSVTIIYNFWNLNGAVMWTLFVMNSVIFVLIGLRGPSKVEVSCLLEKNHLNVAHGLAWSYYFTYLRFVAPGFRERILKNTTEGDFTGKLITKLIILIPESCYACVTLSDADDHISVKYHLSYQVKKGDKVGRTFNQTVYCIQRVRPQEDGSQQQGQKYYCVVEYATPLMALHEMVEVPESGMTSAQREEQMRLFYTTLHNIIKQVPEVADNLLLIPYKDRTTDCSLSEIILSKALSDESH